MIYSSTPITTDFKKSIEFAKRAARYNRLDGPVVSPVLALSYLGDSDWLIEKQSLELMKMCDVVYAFADEVDELMISQIKYAQKLGLPIHFYDADLNQINYDALVINRRIGPGYRKMIVEAHGDKCCPCCGEMPGYAPIPKTEPAETEPAKTEATDKATDSSVDQEKQRGVLSRVFGKAR